MNVLYFNLNFRNSCERCIYTQKMYNDAPKYKDNFQRLKSILK